jgi:voltage-gated potassium channel
VSKQRLVQMIPSRKQQRPSYVRTARATWHDSQALFNEFRRPLMVFLVSLFLGGYFYMYLNNNFSDNRHLDFVDMPYIMLALMVLEASIEVPDEFYLIAFWYLQPFIAVYIVGRGAADFVRLFLNRDERRDAWEAAVAATYRKHVIIIGVGHVGMRVTRTLVQMGFDVVAVDINVTKQLDEDLRNVGVPIVTGDARNVSILEQAGLKYANAVIIATSNDHINLEVTMRVRDMNPDIRLVSRMWDDRLAQQMERFFDVEVLSASDLAAPAFAGAAVGAEITQNLHIAGMEYSMIRLVVRKDSFMDGLTIDVIQEDQDVDIVLLHRANNGIPEVHPDGEIIVHDGDTIVLFANHDKITEIVSRNEASHAHKGR